MFAEHTAGVLWGSTHMNPYCKSMPVAATIVASEPAWLAVPTVSHVMSSSHRPVPDLAVSQYSLQLPQPLIDTYHFDGVTLQLHFNAGAVVFSFALASSSFHVARSLCHLHVSCQAFAACRTGNVLVNGTIGSAMVRSSGTGSVYLLGVNTSVVVDLAGVSSVYLRNANRKSASSQICQACSCGCLQEMLHMGIPLQM